MSRVLVISAVLGIVCLAAGSKAHALSCQGRIIDPGDRAARVRAYCGDPATVTERVVERSRSVYVRGPHGSLVRDEVAVSVVVQEWVYDFGPQRFMQELTFEDGELRTIRELGYGTPNGHPVQTRLLEPPSTLPIAHRRRARV